MTGTELSDKDLEGYVAARSFTRELSKDIIKNIKMGMTEKEIEELASEVFRNNGVKQHWHMPVIGVGEGSTKLRSAYALASSYITKHTRVLEENDLVLVDIAPVYNDYPSDYTTSHVAGQNPDLEALVAFAHDVSLKIADHVNRDMTVADVFGWAGMHIKENSMYTLAFPPFISLGHRLCRIPPLWQNFPESGLTYLILGANSPFINSTNRALMRGLWVIEPYLMYKERASKFETLVFVGEETVVLDREG